jgi:hypothetical protein
MSRGSGRWKLDTARPPESRTHKYVNGCIRICTQLRDNDIENEDGDTLRRTLPPKISPHPERTHQHTRDEG